MVEAGSAEEVRQIILADLAVDEGSYDDHLEPVECGSGDVTVAVENEHVQRRLPAPGAWSLTRPVLLS